MSIQNIHVFEYIHSCQHSFHLFDVTFIVCDGKKILYNLVETKFGGNDHICIVGCLCLLSCATFD